MGTTGDGRRGEERSPITLVVEYDDQGDFLSDYTANLSRGGTFVYTDRALADGQEVLLVLSFPGLVSPLHVPGEVRWSRGEGDDRGVGITFLEPELSVRRISEVAEAVNRNDSGVLSRVVRLLVVEDNPHVARLIKDGLGSSRVPDLSFSFRTAGNGVEALELLEEETFDAVIIDVYLPIMDGPQVIGEIRKREALRDMPIIAVSAGGPAAREDALAAGANFFLDKPMRLRQILDSIRALLSVGAD